MKSEYSEVTTRQMQTVWLEINCLVEHLDRSLYDKDLTYVEVIQAGRKKFLRNWEELLEKQLNLENELGVISQAIGRVKGHIYTSSTTKSLYEYELYVLEILRNAITEFDIPTNYYFDLSIQQIKEQLLNHNQTVIESETTGQEYKSRVAERTKQILEQMQFLTEEESDLGQSDSLIEYLLEKNYFQELLWPELLQFGLVKFSWNQFYVERNENGLLVGVTNEYLPFLAESGNLSKYAFRWSELVNKSLSGLPDWISIDTHVPVSTAVNMNTGLFVDEDPDYGVPTIYGELYEFKSGVVVHGNYRTQTVYEAFLAQRSDQSLITKAGENALTAAYSWLYGSEDDCFIEVRSIKLSNQFSFDYVPTWSKLPKMAMDKLTHSLLDYFSNFSTPLSSHPLFQDWKQEFVLGSFHSRLSGSSWDGIEDDWIFYSVYTDFYFPRDKIERLPAGVLFKGQPEATLGDASKHLLVEYLLCLIAIHPSTPIEIIQKLENVTSSKIQRSLLAVKEGLI